jgi:hypothetical protein
MMHMEEISQVGQRSRLGINQLTMKITALVIDATIVLLLNDYSS